MNNPVYVPGQIAVSIPGSNSKEVSGTSIENYQKVLEESLEEVMD